MSSTAKSEQGSTDLERARKVANAVESLCNVFYLIENQADRPDDIRTYVQVGAPALQVLVDFAWEVQRSMMRDTHGTENEGPTDSA
jgi:hypothetical protein